MSDISMCQDNGCPLRLYPGWLAVELAAINAEIEHWPIGIRESFDSLQDETQPSVAFVRGESCY